MRTRKEKTVVPRLTNGMSQEQFEKAVQVAAGRQKSMRDDGREMEAAVAASDLEELLNCAIG